MSTIAKIRLVATTLIVACLIAGALTGYLLSGGAPAPTHAVVPQEVTCLLCGGNPVGTTTGTVGDAPDTTPGTTPGSIGGSGGTTN